MFRISCSAFIKKNNYRYQGVLNLRLLLAHLKSLKMFEGKILLLTETMNCYLNDQI